MDNHCPYCRQTISSGQSAAIWKKIHYKEHADDEKRKQERDRLLALKLRQAQEEFRKRQVEGQKIARKREEQLKKQYEQKFDQRIAFERDKAFNKAKRQLSDQYEQRVRRDE